MRYANLLLVFALTSPLVAQIQILRGSSRAPAPAAEAEQSAETATGEGAETTAPRDPRERQRETVIYSSGGQSRSGGVTEQRSVNGDVRSLVQRVRSINGREVPYLTETERVLSSSDSLKVSERVRQRYDATGRGAGQGMERVEERKLPDGGTETTTTVYEADLNGRMQPAERRVVRTTKSGNETHTVETTQTTGMNGRFQTVVEKESIERRNGEESGTIETTTKTRQGDGGLRVASREETAMRMENGVAVTETQKFERSPATDSMDLAARIVGRLTERPDGSGSETVETYGFSAGDGRNINATRMQLQSVSNSQVTVNADGSVRERTTFKERSSVDTSQFTDEQLTQKVSRPTADGESVQTDIFEKGINGRMTATESVVEKIEK
jgi:hypothetical protein